MNWLVLLIGGSSGTGKTTLAQQVAAYYTAECVQADDLRLVMQRITTPATHPDLHFFVDPSQAAARGAMTPEQLAERLRRIGQIVSQAVESIVAHHLATMRPIVLEGDAILPALAAQTQYDTFTLLQPGRVRYLLLEEGDETHLRRNMQMRLRGLAAASEATQPPRVTATWRYGQWLKSEATARGLPVLAARPYETLIERALNQLR